MTAAPVVLAVAGLWHPHHLEPGTAAAWTGLHVLLLPVFPLLGVGFPLLLRGIRGGAAGLLSRLALSCAYLYAVLYTGLDAVAGIGTGTLVTSSDQPFDAIEGELNAIFAIGNRLGITGSAAFLAASVAAGAALIIRYGPTMVPGTALLVLASVPWLRSHIYWPIGGLTVLAIGAGFALLAVALNAAQRGSDQDGVPAIGTAGWSPTATPTTNSVTG